MSNISRRKFIQVGAAGAAGVFAATSGLSAMEAMDPRKKKKVQPEPKPEKVKMAEFFRSKGVSEEIISEGFALK